LVDVQNNYLPSLPENVIDLTIVNPELTPKIPKRRRDRCLHRNNSVFVVSANWLGTEPQLVDLGLGKKEVAAMAVPSAAALRHELLHDESRVPIDCRRNMSSRGIDLIRPGTGEPIDVSRPPEPSREPLKGTAGNPEQCRFGHAANTALGASSRVEI